MMQINLGSERLFQLANLITLVSCVRIKIIDAPFSLQNAGLQAQQHQSSQPDVKIQAKIQPKPFSGPPHLASLSGKCFKLQKTSYKYEFCPFHNVTQREQSYRWNAFHGVLGVWKEWSVTNNTFEYMWMTNGETCIGATNREVMVYFKCGNEDKFEDIQEPRTCIYNLTFQTPLACAEDALMVYPILREESRKEWDKIEDAYFYEELTLQGYNKQIRKILIKEGLVMDENGEKKASHSEGMSADSNLSVESPNNDGKKELNKDQCTKENGILREEVQRLRQELEKLKKNEGARSNDETFEENSIQTNIGALHNKSPNYSDNVSKNVLVNKAGFNDGGKDEEVQRYSKDHESESNVSENHIPSHRSDDESKNGGLKNTESIRTESSRPDSANHEIAFKSHDAFLQNQQKFTDSDSRKEESKNEESRSEDSKNEESKNEESLSEESKNEESRNDRESRKDLADEEPQHNKSRIKESSNHDSNNNKSQTTSQVKSSSHDHADRVLNQESPTIANQTKGLIFDKNQTVKSGIEKPKRPRGKLGEDERSYNIPFKIQRKTKGGKMGDEGVNVQPKKHETVQGHVMGKFNANERKRIDDLESRIKRDEKNKESETHQNHLHH